MSERAKPKHVRKQNWSDEAIEWQTGTGEFDREATIENRELLGEGKRLQYTAPGVEQKWRARDLVDIHWKLVSIDPPSESYNRIMSCIIGHANPHNGRCQLKQKLIAAETGYSVDTVQRAIKWWESKGFLKTQSMGLGRSTAYQPQWNLFELHFIGVAHDIATQKESWALASCYQTASENVPVSHQGAARGGHHGAVHESQIGISKDEPQHEMVRPPLVADTGIYLNEKEGIQREEVEGLSTNPNLPAEPNVYTLINLDAEKRGAAAAAIDADLSRHPKFQTLLGWPELESHLGDAASAELHERGSGAKLVLARFAERKTTGT